ncbi:MAG TPA: histidine phosphatase family protein [Candidatus Saccharimonadales bacterium]|nr:histidine phosphatase family protein [Candidatus Saccharimonadales bacterium]
MKYLLIRHGKTDANRTTRAAYGTQGAPLNDDGIQQAKALRWELLKHDIILSNEPAAVSELLRAKQTAEVAGLKNIHTNSLLNEVNTPDQQKTTEDIKKGILAPEAIAAAKKLLANPPKERIWVTHGQLIAAILAELKQADPDTFMPDFCEIRVVEL